MDTLDKLQEKLQFESYHLRHEMERFSAQIKFAERLKELFPQAASEWSGLIGKAVKSVNELSELSSYEQLKQAVRKAEDIMIPIAKFAKKYTVYCVGHAHIDMNWKWSWPETVAVTNDTFSTVLKLMDEYSDFVFSQSQASVYEIVEKYNPAMLEEIRRRVREKRWEVTASHWVEGDKNLVSGETLTRHLLYTRAYVKQLFGLEPEDVIIDWAPDTFGHAVTVPSYLVRGGVRFCYLHRPGNFGSRRPGMFYWQAPDGTRVLVRNDMIHAYNGRVSSNIGNNLINFVKENGSFSYMFVYGLGDHGGGPTRCDLNRILDMAAWPVFPEIKFAAARSFFEAFEREVSELPVLEEELNVEFTGCYTSQSLIKKANRYSENRLADAEFGATMAWKLLEQDYPQEKLEHSWKNCLFNHFHDILPGSGVRDTRHYTMGLFQNIMAATGMVETLALRRLAAAVNTSESGSPEISDEFPSTFYQDAFGAGVGIGVGHGNLSTAEQSLGRGSRPFVIFNPTAADRQEVVEATVWDNPVPGDTKPLADRQYAVMTPDRKLIPAQFIAEGREWAHRYVKLAFPVKLSGFSYALYTINEAEIKDYKSDLKLIQTPHHCGYSTNERATIFGGENADIILEINPVTGGILRLHDKKSGLDIIGPERQVPLFEYAVERPHGMSSWLIDFCGKREEPEIKSISQLSFGPYKIAVRVEAEIRNSKFTVTYEIGANNPAVSINIKGLWLETGNKNAGYPSLRMPFAFNLDAAEAVYEIPFGAINRDLKHDEEVPALQWAKVVGTGKGKPAGGLLLNDCKYGHALDGDTLRISLLRSSCHPDPAPDLGEHEINLALLPFSGNLSTAECTEHGQNFNRSLKVIGTDLHPGELPPAGQFIKISADNVIVSGFKKAEHTAGIVIRLYETEGKNSKPEIIFDDVFGKIKAAATVDLMERPIADLPENRIGPNKLSVNLGAYGIVSLLVYFTRERPEH
ncbi:MAG: glycoside hydrolase family 38 C-terminal domain-containing protein [Victivallaceae bacterium]|nr:glycoside hydrolase family 38 C-terminal domain-containing protein [Victivallaceae bacterium]